MGKMLLVWLFDESKASPVTGKSRAADAMETNEKNLSTLIIFMTGPWDKSWHFLLWQSLNTVRFRVRSEKHTHMVQIQRAEGYTFFRFDFIFGFNTLALLRASIGIGDTFGIEYHKSQIIHGQRTTRGTGFILLSYLTISIWLNSVFHNDKFAIVNFIKFSFYFILFFFFF